MRARELIAHDLAQTFNRASVPEGTLALLALLAQALVTVKGIAIVGHRVAHRLGRRTPLLAGIVKQLAQAISGADIGHRAVIGPGLRLYHPAGVVISEQSRIGSFCTIQSCTTIGRETEVGDFVEIGPGARVLATVKVDEGCHLAANAVLSRSVPGPWMVLAGIPARQLRPRERPAA